MEQSTSTESSVLYEKVCQLFLLEDNFLMSAEQCLGEYDYETRQVDVLRLKTSSENRSKIILVATTKTGFGFSVAITI